MKKIEEWLSELPVQYRTIALAARSRKDSMHFTTKFAEDHAQALVKAFNWKVTSQGATFWANVYDGLKTQRILPTVIDPKEPLVQSNYKEPRGRPGREIEILDRLQNGEHILAQGDVSNMSRYARNLREKGIDVRSMQIRNTENSEYWYRKIYYLHVEA